MRVELCYACGAPLESRWSQIVLVCRYCQAENAPGGKGAPVPSSVPDDGRLRFGLDGRTYLVFGQLGRGDSADVYFGRWVRRLGELVVIKILRCAADRDLLDREQAILQHLCESQARGTDHFASLIPEPIARGPVRFHDRERFVSVFRWRSGFLHTVEEVMQVHSQGVEPGVAVWALKRILEVLHWTHQSGHLHSAVLPPHVLIHPRNHGALLIGWSAALKSHAAAGTPHVAVSRAWKDWYFDSRRASRTGDIAMAARCALKMAGASSFTAAGTIPNPLAELFVSAARGEHADAWKLREQITERSLEALGPPAYCPLSMPGWPGLPQTQPSRTTPH